MEAINILSSALIIFVFDKRYAVPDVGSTLYFVKAFAIKAYANEVIKDVLMDSLNPVATRNNLEKVTLNSLLSTRPVNVEDERRQVVHRMQKLLSTDSIYSIRKKIADELNLIAKNPYDKKAKAYTFDINCKACNSIEYDDNLCMVILTTYNKRGDLIARTVIKPPSFVTYNKMDEDKE